MTHDPWDGLTQENIKSFALEPINSFDEIRDGDWLTFDSWHGNKFYKVILNGSLILTQFGVRFPPFSPLRWESEDPLHWFDEECTYYLDGKTLFRLVRTIPYDPNQQPDTEEDI